MTRPGSPLRSLLPALVACSVLLCLAPAAHAAPEDARCRAEGLTTAVTALTLPVLVANPAGAPCVDDAVGLNGQLPAGIHLGTLQAVTTQSPPDGPPEARLRTAATSVNDLDVDLIANLLAAGTIQSSVTATCTAGRPAVAHSSSVQGLRLLNRTVTPNADGVVEVAGTGLNGLLPTQVARVTVNRWAQDLDGTGGTQTALRLQVLTLGVPTVDLVAGRSSASVTGVDCGASAPAVVVTDNGTNRRVTASVTAGSAPVTTTTLAVRPSGSSGAFTTVPSTFSSTTGTVLGTLDRASFPAGAYEVRATAADNAGRAAAATGAVTIALPTAGTPVLADRALVASVAGPPGTSLASCSFTLTPSNGGAATTVPGTLGSGTCTGTVAAGVPAGAYDVTVAATDANGDRGVASASGVVGTGPTGPAVVLLATGNRAVAAATSAGSAGAATDCVVAVRPAGSSGAFTDLPTTLAAGRCDATLPAGDFDPGTYEVRVTATDADSLAGTAGGTVTIGSPVVGPVTVDDRDVAAAFTTPPGTTAQSCTVRVATGSTPTTVAGTIDGTTCRATVPDAVPTGRYDVTATVTDSGGDTGSRTLEDVLVGIADPLGAAPTLALLPAAVNRVAVASVAAPAGETIVACTAVARRGTTDIALSATLDAGTGRCRATLPSGEFGAGDHPVTFAATASGGGSAAASGTVTVGTPAVATPTLDGRVVGADVTAAAGVPVAACSVALRAGSLTTTLLGTLANGRCTATAPDDLAAGSYAVEVAVTDTNGDSAATTTTLALEATGTPTGPADPGTPGDSGGTGGTGRTGGSGGTTGTVGSTGSAGAATGGGAGAAGATGPGAPGAAGAGGTAGGDGAAATALAGCGGRRLVLVDVARTTNGVRLAGVADLSLAGQVVALHASGRRGVVARARVSAVGRFSARLRMRGVRSATRFTASLGKDRSLALKLARRLQVVSTARRGGRVTIRARVTAPRPAKGQRVEVRRQVRCGVTTRAGTARTDGNGRITARVAAPEGTVAVFRLVTRVPRRPGERASVRTFSLPVIVELR